MYNLPYFKESDHKEVISFMQHHPFITLCGSDEAGKPVATHVPVLIKFRDDKIFLRGHFMRNTDHHQAFVKNPAVMAIFLGPHTYVSASWYTDPRQGSTWNYLTVHARGKLQFLDDDALLTILRETTAQFEDNEHSPSLFDKLPKEYITRMTKAIVAFEILVDEIDNVFKLSQNRDKDSFHNIIDKLDGQHEDARSVAAEMRARSDKLFPNKEV